MKLRTYKDHSIYCLICCQLYRIYVSGGDEEQGETQQRNTSHLIHSAHSLFPSCLCSAVTQIINLLDDAAVSPDGNSVYEIAYQVFQGKTQYSRVPQTWSSDFLF